jgi:hypothetical protein
MAQVASDANVGNARPNGVPSRARFFFDAQEWLLCDRDEHGELHGAVRSYRSDGTPWLEYEYRHGRRHGPFRRFHASGALAQVGRFFDDLLDGLLTVYSDAHDTYSIRECCIPPGTQVMKQEHRSGQLLAESFYDVAGVRLFEAHLAPERGASTWPEPLREREEDVLLGAFDFWPAREPLSASDPGAARAEQPLGALCDAIRCAAVRLQVFRHALLMSAPHLAPPDVSDLVGAALAPLRRFSFVAEDEQLVHVDETVSLDGSTTLEVALRARIEWSTLCWLCWSAGLDSIALPAELGPRLELYPALLLASDRQAALSAPELRVDSEPHFHGLNEALLPASALAHLAAHYREMRAVLLFVSDPECQSPWQDDLGRSLCP